MSSSNATQEAGKVRAEAGRAGRDYPVRLLIARLCRLERSHASSPPAFWSAAQTHYISIADWSSGGRVEMEPATVLVYILRPIDAVSGVGRCIEQASTRRGGDADACIPVPLGSTDDYFASSCHA